MLAFASVAVASTYETHWITQPHDHFHFGAKASAEWQHRYLLNSTFWDGRGALENGCKGPILFYTGNEGPIDAFWNISGFVNEVLAQSLGALVVFGEERYYGLSLPKLGTPFEYLSTEQVLADYASLLTRVKASLGATSCPVVAFGGSYGGTLTTLFRLKYPHIVAGGLAASAPVGYYAPDKWEARAPPVTQFTWFETVQRVYAEAAPGCYDTLVEAVQAARAAAAAGGAQAAALAKTFGLCSAPSDADSFSWWLTEALESIPQVDYPCGPSGTLPPSPVNATCALFKPSGGGGGGGGGGAPDLLGALATVAQWYYSYGGSGGGGGACLPAAEATSEQVGGGVPGDGPSNSSAWGYQSCTETLHPFSVPAGAWRDFSFDEKAQAALCAEYYGVAPRMGWLAEVFSGQYGATGAASMLTNVIWSNGKRDPWHGGGFLEQSDAVQGGAVIVMETTAHHQDLRAPCAGDPPEMMAARAKEEAIIRSWIAQAASATTTTRVAAVATAEHGR